MAKSVRQLLEEDKEKEYCTAETRQQQTGTSWASTTWTCPNRATNLDTAPFSRKGLIEQLSSKAGDGYPRNVAVFAVRPHQRVDRSDTTISDALSSLQAFGQLHLTVNRRMIIPKGER